MNVFITGVAGFLGSNLANKYLVQGWNVGGIDNFASSDPNSLHLAALLRHPRFSFTSGDVCEYEELAAAVDTAFKGKGVDLILNFACIASPPHYQANSLETIRTSTQGVDNVLAYAKNVKARVLHASTSEVYGDPESSPQSERYWGRVNSFGPRACYDEGKRLAEALVYEYRRITHLDARMIRIFNTYGPAMHPEDGRAVSNFINQALGSQPITIHGDGSQTRSFCYVDDLVRGAMALAAAPSTVSVPMNVGNPVEDTIHDIAELVLAKVPESTSKITYVDRPVDDPGRRKPDITLAQRELGWMPHVCLDAGLDLTIAYFRRLRESVTVPQK